MNEWNKAQAGYLYDANYDREVVENRTKCADLCYEFNQCKPSDTKKQAEIIKKIIGCIKGDFVITAPFYCDYGSNITIGNNFYTNHNCTILDGAKVTFGDNVFIAPNVVFSTAGHAIDAGQRDWKSHFQLLSVTMYGLVQMYLCCREFRSEAIQ